MLKLNSSGQTGQLVTLPVVNVVKGLGQEGKAVPFVDTYCGNSGVRALHKKLQEGE